MTGPVGGISDDAALTSTNELVASSPFLMSAILCRLAFVAVHGVLERLDSDAPIAIEKALVRLADRQIRVHDLANCRRHLGLRQPGPEPVAERRILVGRAAERELKELLAALVD